MQCSFANIQKVAQETLKNGRRGSIKLQNNYLCVIHIIYNPNNEKKKQLVKEFAAMGHACGNRGFVVYGLTLGEKPADVEAYCPFGGLQALGSYLVNNSLACTMSMTQIMVGVMLAVGVILFSKLFCGYLCPLGTVSEWMGRGGKN